jgi:cytidylate kinase
MIITIDGPSGSGKSSVAKELAKFLGYTFFDTGAMYRSLTLHLLNCKVASTDHSAVEEHLKDFNFTIKSRQGVKHYFLDNKDVTDAIRSSEVTLNVSAYSAILQVREQLVKLQQEVSVGVNAVFEGRDMGTVVFPEADLKVFLEADPIERAKRRYEEIVAKDSSQKDKVTVEEIHNAINKRDSFDKNREASPLKQAEDAHLINTTHYSIGEVVQKILEIKESNTLEKKLSKS